MHRTHSLAALAAALVFFATGVHAEEEGPPSILVSGRAELTAPPDFAQFSVQISSRSGDATDAAADNATRSAAVMEALRKAVGEDATLRTESFSVAPEYRYKDGEQTLVGYRALNAIGIELRDPSRVGKVTAAALDAGADTIANLRITLKDDTALRAEALGLAASRARAKANAIAGSLGLKVVRVLRVSENGAESRSRPLMSYDRAAGAASASAPPIAAGPVRVTASVGLRVEIRD
jgi:uncharacterized protein YggE